MPDTSHPPVPKPFLWQWTLATSIGYGVCVTGLTSFDEQSSVIAGILTGMGLLMGLLQWLVLRQVLKGAHQWIWLGWLSFIGFALLIYLLLQFPLVALLWLVCAYSIGMSIGQWLVLRHFVQPSWQWILVSSGTTFLGIGTIVIPLLMLVVWNQPLTFPGAFIGLAGGAIQGLGSGVSLRQLLNRRTASKKAASGREKPPTPQKGMQVITTACFFLCISGWLLLILQTIPINLGSPIIVLLFLLAIVVYLYASILIHELGHLLGALASGFKLNFLTVMRFALIQQQGKLRLRRMQKLSAGGLTSTVPTSCHNLRQKLMILIAGGPIASFSLFLLGLVFLPFPTLVSQNPLLLVLVSLAGLNLYLAIANSLPLKVGFYTTDGYILSALVRNTVEGQRFLAMYEYLASVAQGVRPKELSAELVERSLAQPEQSMHHGYGLIMAYYKALDQADINQAGTFLDDALAIKDYMPDFIRSSLFMEAAYFEAFHRHSATTAQEWFDQVQEFVFLKPYTQRRVEGAIALAQGKLKEAKIKAKAGLDMICVDSLNKGMAIAEHDWLNQILTQSTSM